ncbi:pre-peptidase [Nostoc sp. C057]|uniref:pre-peptidase C-terminal domain-containing protein n=1 Tax=Nostoc sp. C057 TaxID=2576903 RepID=UPI0015C34CCC|nr:pre-peptidase C-terminal domain-containing protein [Nostoc sp. C057]QLE49622.1 pre-peptidase [Nostoc sp. C057]
MPSPYSGFTDPGNTTATALDTTSGSYIGGSLTSTSNIFQDSLSSLDTRDYYRFTLSSSSIVTLSLDGLAANSDANLYLTNSNGQTIAVSSLSGNASEKIRFTLNNQPANTSYYARIDLVTSAVSTSYNLGLSAEAIQDSGISDNTTALANTNRDISAAVNTAGYSGTDFVASTSSGLVTDASDYYKFTLNNNGTIGINLNPSSGNADIQLLNSSGQSLQPAASSAQTGTSQDSINRSLTAGSYYIQVYTNAGSTNYNLQVNFTADAPDQGGNTVLNATSISLPATVSDLVSASDTQDYYKFTLASTALVDIRFTSLSADANLALQDQNGSGIVSSNQSGTILDAIRRSLNPGTYNILVNRGGATTAANYTLSVVAQTINPDQAGSDSGSAQNLGTLNGSISRSDFVGNIDINDYYKFSLNTTSSFNLTLSGLSDNADVRLFNSVNTQIAISNQTGNSNETISNLTLSAGTYSIRIYPSGSAETFYNLDITAQPQVRQLEINPGSGSADPDNLTTWNNTLYFTANDATTGIQLWKSDGTTNTRITNANGFNPDDLIVFNNKLYFTATNSTFGTELWQYDGTSVTRISDINLNSGSSNPSNLTVVGNKLFFVAVDSSNIKKLWVYNSTSVSLVDINPTFSSSQSPTFVAFNSKLFFTARNNTELWSTDGTIGGTQVISVEGMTQSYPANFRVVGSTLYFTASNGTSGFEVCKYQSGTTASLLKDITPGNNGFAPANLTAVSNTLYFVTDSNNDFNLELWKSDGTVSGTVIIRTNGQAPNVGLGSFNLTAVGNILYFVGNDPVTGLELWRTDGTDANTVLVKDIWAGTDGNNQPNNSIPTSLVNFNGTLTFAASNGSNREVWFSDGTTANTLKVSNINATGNANPGRLTVVGTQLFFTANNGTNGTELYVL